MSFAEESVDVAVPLLAMSMVNADPDKFTGLTFGASVISADRAPQVRLPPQTWGHKFAFKTHWLFFHLIIILIGTSAATRLYMHLLQAAKSHMTEENNW